MLQLSLCLGLCCQGLNDCFVGATVNRVRDRDWNRDRDWDWERDDDADGDGD